MNNLVIAVSHDSSLDLLRQFADVIVLDKESVPADIKAYDTVYIRSHFGQPSASPQNFRTQIDDLASQARRQNPALKFVDSIDSVDDILAF